MEWFSNYFLVNDETFTLTLWSLFLVSTTLLLLTQALKHSKVSQPTSSAPLIREIFLPTFISKPNASVTYVACKKCGNHAIKMGDKTKCLSSVCRLNKN